MIIVRAPLRVSFVGGGTDMADFYTRSPGRVLSAAIDKYVYVSIKRSPLIPGIHVRYSQSEYVNHPSELKNDRVREALIATGITNHVEVAMFSDFPGNTGLGSSSSFSVALMKGLRLCRGDKVDARAVAEDAVTLEVDVLREPIGKQDHYASAVGGINVIQFNSDHSVEIEPLHLDYKKMVGLENHLLMFFTGIRREAKSILTDQKANITGRLGTLRRMADMVGPFRDSLEEGDFKSLGGMLAEGWELKRQLAPGITNQIIDDLYTAGIGAGAWGGKLLGAGGGGCILFIADPKTHDRIRSTVGEVAAKGQLEGFVEMPVRFVHSGVEVLLNSSTTI